MNSGSNSSRNLIASGDLVISLFLSHKALYPSHMQAYTHLYADTDTATHIRMHTHKHMHSAPPAFLFSVYSSLVKKKKSVMLQEQSTKTSTDVLKKQTHLLSHEHTSTQMLISKSSQA